MKYIIGVIIVVFVFFVIRNNFVVRPPNGTYTDDNHAIMMTFESSGRLISSVGPRSSIMLNTRQWNGPDAPQITVSAWERRGDTIYVTVPGRREPIPAIRIDGDELRMDDIRFRRTKP